MKIQTKISMILAAVLIAVAGYSQTSDSRESLKFGIKVGGNLSNIYDEEGKDFIAENKIGFVGGAFIAIPLGKFIGIQPEVMYSEKGFKATGKTLLGSYDFKRTLSYLDIPIQFQLKPIKEVTILVGPQFSYLLRTKNDFNGNTSTTEQDDINADNYKKNIFGFVIGADFNFDPLVIGVRGAWDINKSDANGDTSTPRYKNQVLQLTLGFAF